ncbi:MAG: DUF2169 domain-containing protein, partial [Deltaproteobacteria bacterium]|nr:DUF2169 domain-containing protein [Deltaproteobacteria bacterium]MBW2531704.1 DUF2169 domain-containing protein [Deltaproteobacteria bacterium]
MPSPPSIENLTATSSAATLWRLGGKLHVVVAVKASFDLVLDGPMVPAPPSPIAVADRVPYRPGTDVSFVGRAYLEERTGSAKLGLYADEALASPVLVKAVAVRQAEPDPTGVPLEHDASTFVPEAALAPIPPDWEVRQRLAAQRPEGWLLEQVVEVEDDFDWAFFRSVPTDQQCDFLAGYEWVVLDRLVRSAPTFKTQLPQAKAVMRVMTPTAMGGPIPLESRIDTLTIDGEAGRCEVTWRGSFSVDDEAALKGMAVFAGVELGGKQLSAWPSNTGTLGESLAPELAARSRPGRSEAAPAVASPPAPAPPAMAP